MKLAALLFTLCVTNVAAFRICSFNIQSFGEAKSAKPEVMTVIVKVVSRCDVMLLMEIKDGTDRVINSLMAKLNSQTEMEDDFNLIISQRLGRKTYKEQYAFIYRKHLVSVKDVYQYHDHQVGDIDAFSREPFVVWFKTYKNDFVIIPQHTTPEAAIREIDELYDVYLDVKQKWKVENFIFMGDFNADCSYVPKKYWKNIRLRTNQEFIWLIDDNVDTTVKSSTDCAYDRIVLHGKRLVNSVVPGSATVFDFMNAYGLTEAQALEISDHFPVEFRLTHMRKQKPAMAAR
ncbi:deoxyribonuclease gamma [Anomaloglossus baeobatrachus]|uniref:deoxyribonuclease gamma n=1 Tax=Anomaloglossus baeobatrachus TaxID=238106 RepID=UPI003F4F578F